MTAEHFGESLKNIAQRLSRVLVGDKRRNELYGHSDGKLTTICEGTFPNDQLLAILRKAVPFAVQAGAFDEEAASAGRVVIDFDYLMNARESNVAFVDLQAVAFLTVEPCYSVDADTHEETTDFYVSTWHFADDFVEYMLRSRDVAEITARILQGADKAGFVSKKVGHSLTVVNPAKVASMRIGEPEMFKPEEGQEEGIVIGLANGSCTFIQMPADDARFFYEDVAKRVRGF